MLMGKCSACGTGLSPHCVKMAATEEFCADSMTEWTEVKTTTTIFCHGCGRDAYSETATDKRMITTD